MGITGHCAALGESIVVGDAANSEFGHQIEGTPAIEESLLAVPLRYGSQVVGVIVVSKLGLDQFDEDEVRLLEVLAGHAAVAIENARLFEAARREAESATALLEFGRELATLVERDDIVERVTQLSAGVLGSRHTSLWLERDGELRLASESGHTPEWSEKLAGWTFPVDGISVRSDPYLIGPTDYADIVAEPTSPGGTYAVAPFDVDGRAGCIVALVERERLRRARAPAARRPRAPGEACDRERLELRRARADVRLHRRGARERARGERRVHVGSCALDQ